MRFLKETDVDFIGMRRFGFVISSALLLAGLISLMLQGGPRLGIDFKGGTLVAVAYNERMDINEIRDVLSLVQIGESQLDLSRVEIKHFGADTSIAVRLPVLENAPQGFEQTIVDILYQSFPSKVPVALVDAILTSAGEQADKVNAVLQELGVEQNPALSSGTLPLEVRKNIPRDEARKIKAKLEDAGGSVEIRHNKGRFLLSMDKVGPKIGAELKGKAVLAILSAIIGILIYISIRFEFKFAVGAIAALVHDVLITLGIFSIMNYEISLAIIAAFLTIVGYSLNDTIVVFDRVRENLKRVKQASFGRIINQSINQSLSRTVITSLTTFVVVFTLWVAGGEVIKYFAFAMMVGVIVGTYSSIFIASPVVILWQERIIGRKPR